MLSERQERIAEVEAEIDGLLARVLASQGDAAARPAPARSTRPLPGGPSARWPWYRPAGSTPGPFPHLTPEGVVRQAFNLFSQAIGREAFDGLDNAGVEDAPTLLERLP